MDAAAQVAQVKVELMEMNEGNRGKTIIVPAAAVFIVFLMSLCSAVGAVELGTVNEKPISTFPDGLNPDQPGEPDHGYETGRIITGSGENIDGAPAQDLNHDEKNRLAESALGDIYPEVGEESFDLGSKLESSATDLRSYKENLDENLRVSLNRMFDPEPGAESRPVSNPADYSANLYTSVQEYLKNVDRPIQYITLEDELKAYGFTPDKEEVSKRTQTSKSFLNEDGTYTAILDQVPIHYRDEFGNWKDIDLNIRANPDGGFRVLENTIASYFEDDTSVMEVDFGGENWFRWTPEAQSYTDNYGIRHIVSYAENSKGAVSGNMISYRNTYKNTDEEFLVFSDHLKHNLILNAKAEEAYDGLFLSYSGKVELATGLSLYVDGVPVESDIQTSGSIEVHNDRGECVYILPSPFAYEYGNGAESIDGSYFIFFTGSGIYISINIPLSWLNDPLRTYPVVIDPNLYATLNIDKGGYIYKYSRVSSSSSYTYYYHYTSSSRRIGFYGYKSGSYTYSRIYRSWFKWDTSSIPDSNNIIQIDFHGKQWRNSYSTFTVNIRDAPLEPESYSSTQAQRKALFESIVKGKIYNSSVSFPRATSYTNIDIFALGGQANQDLKANLTNDAFYLTMHKVVESLSSTGYGYFSLSQPNMAQLFVTYNPCPIPPKPDTGGPYMVPEGSNGVWLDASDTFVCGSTVMYYWDTDEDGTYDRVSSLPRMFWNKQFPDDWSVNLSLMVKDITNKLTTVVNTTFTVYNVNPQIISPASKITGNEGSTVTMPKVEFTDPGKDRWKYYYDFDGDGKWDKTGDTVTLGGRYYVPSVSWYFCDNTDSVLLTIEDEDGGYSDRVEQENIDATYDGDLTLYTRPADSTRGGYYRAFRYYSYTYMYVRYQESMTSYDYDYRGLIKFDTSSLPSTFKPTNITLRTYVDRVSSPGKVGVNDLGNDPYFTAWSTLYADADSSNIIDKENYRFIDTTDLNRYVDIYLNPQDFTDKVKFHPKWYGIGLDRYDDNEKDIYIGFRGGVYTTLTVTDGTSTYRLNCYTNSGSNTNGGHGYIYKYFWPERYEMWRSDTSSYIYVEEYDSSYSSHYSGRGFLKFGPPSVDVSRVVGADLKVYAYIYSTPNDIKVSLTDLDADPKLASDASLWNDISSEDIYDGVEWAPAVDYTTYIVPVDDNDYVDKINAHSDWYGIGFKKNSGLSRYIRLYSNDYSIISNRPQLIVDYRVPFEIPAEIANLDPVLDTSKMRLSNSIVKEGDTVTVSEITYTDQGNCDTHEFRVIIPTDDGSKPKVVKDWTPASGGKLSFDFVVPDDDPDDADADVSKDKLTMQIEFKDDDYIPDVHYSTIQLELNHYEYYRYSWYKDWGVYQNEKSWDESTVSWASYPRSFSKSTPEDTVKAHGKHYYSYPYSYHFDIWNITALAKKWLDGSVDNYGVRVQPTTAGKDPNRLYTSDYSTVSRRPNLRFIPREPTQQELVLMPGPADGIDAMLRDYPYNGNNYGSYSYLTYTYDSSTSSNRYETNGLIMFDLSGVLRESDESGIDREPITLTVNNVAPTIDSDGYTLKLPDDTEVETVKEGQEFIISGITFDDPAAGQPSEVFEYRIDWGNGTPSAWSKADIIMPGGGIVVPNNRELSEGSSNNVIPFRPSFGRRMYQQWYAASHLGGESRSIMAVGFRPNGGNVDDQWSTSYADLNVYLSHTKATTLSYTFADNHGYDRTLVYSGPLAWDHKADDPGWMEIPFDNNFNYDGSSNLVLEVSYTSGKESGNSPAVMDADYSSSMHRLYASGPGSTTGSRSTGYGLVTIFKYDDQSKPYGSIPDIRFGYPDDHPETDTPSDQMVITLELRDDDRGIATAKFKITVENVPPVINPGQILVNGVAQQPNILIVHDAYYLYDTSDWVNAIKANFQRPAVRSSSGLTLAEMNKYDLVFWLEGGGPVRYLSTTERTLITGFINSGGKIILSGTYWYNYYSWAPAFYGQFGIQSYTSSYYISSGRSTTIQGSGGLGGDDEYTIDRNSGIYNYYYYISRARLNGGTAEFYHPAYTSGLNYVMVHKSNAATGSVAMMWGFDLKQISDPEKQNALIQDVLEFFGFESIMTVEINEGDDITLKNFDIVDPAEGVPTESLSYKTDWGDGEIGIVVDATDQDGINMDPKGSDTYIVVPNDHETKNGNSQNTIPLGPGFGTRRYQQWYRADQLGGRAQTIEAIGFRISGTFSLTYNNLAIYLSHTTNTGLSTVFSSNYGTGRVQVLYRSAFTYSRTTSVNDFQMIKFDKPFNYDGSSNLVMEFVYTTGTGGRIYFDADSDSSMQRLYASTATSTTGYRSSSYGLVTKFDFKSTTPPSSPQPWQSYMHRYRDNSCRTDYYIATIHTYDDDQGHSTLDIKVMVNNVKPTIKSGYIMPDIVGYESGSPSVILPRVEFEDPATQPGSPKGCKEIWTYWWDLDGNGIMNNAPDLIGKVNYNDVVERGNRSFGKTPAVKAVVNDDYINKPVALYMFDDDMELDLGSKPDTATGTLTVKNRAPVASIEAYIPVEVRVRLTGRLENDLNVKVRQTNPANAGDVITDEFTIERMHGQPKDNPFADGSSFSPIPVKIDPTRKVEVVVSFDAVPDQNDIYNTVPLGSDPAWVYLDFPLEDDYDPRDGDQGSSGHHWAGEYKFNVQQDGSTKTVITDVSSVLEDKKGYLVGSAFDDSSDDAQFQWQVISGNIQMHYNTITYYNDGSDPAVNGKFKDSYPSPWTGTAPVTYTDKHEFTYAGSFTVSLYVIDDDGSKSNTATFTLF